MLETEIKALREEVVALRETLATFTDTLRVATPQDPPVKKTKAVPAPKPDPDPEPVQEVTISDLQELCSEIVRADRSKRDAIMDTIKGFGAPALASLPDDADLAALKAKLEVLR